MKILVTGGAGFIGSNLVESLVKEHEVVVLDNLHSGNVINLKNVKKDIDFINGSCSKFINLAPPDIDIIYHLGIPSSSPMYKENPQLVGDAINGAINVFEYARKEEVKKVIFASSSSLYNGLTPPHNENMDINVSDYYTEARLAIERIAKLYNLMYNVKSIGLRFFSVYGPHEEYKHQYANIITQFIWEMKKNQSPVIYGNGEQSRDFIFVKDIVKACKLMMPLNCGFDIFNVGTGYAYSFNDAVEMLNTEMGTNIKPVYVDMPIKNYVDKTLSDTTKISKIGFKPDYSLERGIEEIL